MLAFICSVIGSILLAGTIVCKEYVEDMVFLDSKLDGYWYKSSKYLYLGMKSYRQVATGVLLVPLTRTLARVSSVVAMFCHLCANSDDCQNLLGRPPVMIVKTCLGVLQVLALNHR